MLDFSHEREHGPFSMTTTKKTLTFPKLNTRAHSGKYFPRVTYDEPKCQGIKVEFLRNSKSKTEFNEIAFCCRYYSFLLSMRSFEVPCLDDVKGFNTIDCDILLQIHKLR